MENGTLPENIPFTLALQAAIVRYGAARGLGRYVLWRDHHLMWSSEHLSKKYGRFPYPGVPKPIASPYIQYIVQHDVARQRMLEWAGSPAPAVVPNPFDFAPARLSERSVHFARDYGLPPEALVIARCTRIIPQKRIDREIRLLPAILQRLQAKGCDREVRLVISGPRAECPAETRKLDQLAAELHVQRSVIYADGLLPLELQHVPDRYSIRDLLAHSTLSSFLTSYDYECFGSPPGEAIAACVPYVSTRYELYGTVYANAGFKGLVFPADDRTCLSRQAADAFAEFLCDEQARRKIARANYKRGLQHFSFEAFERRLRELFPAALGAAPAATARQQPEKQTRAWAAG